MKTVPKKTVTRALLYIRTLDGLIKEDRKFISSQSLAEITGLTDVQIRKDISKFGRVGKPRIGYSTVELKKVLEDFIVQNVVYVALFGVGNLGSAILRYPGFQRDKIKIVAAFDKDTSKIGKTINGVPIHSIKDVSQIIKSKQVEIGIIAVPKEFSQDIADIMVAAGLKGIVNFSPVSVKVPEDVFVKDIDLSIEFLSLFCDLHVHRKK